MKNPELSEEDRRKRLAVAARSARRYIGAKRNRTTREAQVIAYAAIGRTDEEMAQALGVQTTTIHSYWRRVLVRFNARTRAEVVATTLISEIVRLREEIVELRAKVERPEEP